MFEFAVAGLNDPVQATVPWLSLSILVPIVGALLVPLVPDKGEGKQVRWYALIVTDDLLDHRCGLPHRL